MTDVPQKNRRNRILQALQNEANKATLPSVQNKNFKEKFRTKKALTVAQRLKLLHDWQATRRELVRKVFGCIQTIERLEKNSIKRPGLSNFDQHKNTSGTSGEKSRPTPQHIRALLNLTDGDMVSLGPNGTKIRKEVLATMNWTLTNANITRKILMEVFDRQTLATHTLSGKPSPAFMDCNKPTKLQLNPEKVQDIIYLLTNSLDMSEKDVRQAITTKCADENKMYRQREERRLGKVKRSLRPKTENNNLKILEYKKE